MTQNGARLRLAWLFLVAIFAADAPSQAGVLHGVGVMGDSLSDEYEFTSYNYARNWVEQLAVHRGLNIGTHSAVSRGEPRRQGYEYNWARGGATTSSLLSSGQHTGLANQVSAGDVTLAVLAIGANDFSPGSANYSNIYHNGITGAARQNLIDNIVTRITTALDTVSTAGTVRMVLGTVPDYGFAPITQASFPDPLRRARVSSVIGEINDQLTIEANLRNIPVADLKGLADFITSGGPQMTIGGVTIDVFQTSTGPYTGFVHDSIHINTTLQGILANLFIEAINTGYGHELDSPLMPFSDLELLQHAGIENEYTGETFSTSVSMSNFVTFTPVPEPSTWLLALAGAASLAPVLRRRYLGREK